MKTFAPGNDDGSITLTTAALCIIIVMGVMVYSAYANALSKRATAMEKKIERFMAAHNEID